MSTQARLGPGDLPGNSGNPNGGVRTMNTDPLVPLAACRAAIIANKTRDFAAAYPNRAWPEETHWNTRDLATGQPFETLSREDYNARERNWERKHTLLPSYELARMRAMRPVSGLAMAEMRAMATRCVTAANHAVATMRGCA